MFYPKIKITNVNDFLKFDILCYYYKIKYYFFASYLLETPVKTNEPIRQ